MCEVLGVHRSGFCRCRYAPESKREARKEQVTSLVKDTFEADYGAPRIAQELNALGHKCSVNFIVKIMQEQGIE